MSSLDCVAKKNETKTVVSVLRATLAGFRAELPGCLNSYNDGNALSAFQDRAIFCCERYEALREKSIQSLF